MIFAGWIFACGAMINKTEIGLDQSLSMPEVILHFNSFGQMSYEETNFLVLAVYWLTFRFSTVFSL